MLNPLHKRRSAVHSFGGFFHRYPTCVQPGRFGATLPGRCVRVRCGRFSRARCAGHPVGRVIHIRIEVHRSERPGRASAASMSGRLPVGCANRSDWRPRASCFALVFFDDNWHPDLEVDDTVLELRLWIRTAEKFIAQKPSAAATRPLALGGRLSGLGATRSVRSVDRTAGW